MKAAAYVPVSCSECTSLHLQLVEAGAPVSCAGCGGPALVLPGATYEPSDVDLFERIDAAVRFDLKSAGAGYRLASDLRHPTSRAETPAEILLRLVDELPSLSFLLPPLCVKPPSPAQTAEMTRATGMLPTIVVARMRQLELARLRPPAGEPAQALDELTDARA